MKTGSTIYINLPYRSRIDGYGCNIRIFRQLKIAYRAMIRMHDMLSLVVGRIRRERMGMNGMEGIHRGIRSRMGMKELNSINVQH